MKTNKITPLITALLAVMFTACAQTNTTKEKKQATEMRPIDKLYSNIQPLQYKSMNRYFIEANQSGCFYELYVNGRMVFKLFKQVGLMGHTTCINDAILKSGMQEVTVKLYPLGQTEVERFDTFTKNARIEVKIEKYDTQVEDSDEKVVTFKIPEASTRSKNDIKIEGLPYYEHTFTFYAEVPYEVTGWSESQDLTKMNQKQLEKEVVAFYNNLSDVIYNQDEAKWVSLVKKRELEFLKSEAYNDVNKESIKDRIRSFKQIFDSKFKKKEPLDKYEMIFGGNGRIVALKSLIDRGYGAFSHGYEEVTRDGRKSKIRNYEYIYLHKPKGSNKLEIIR
ncbi:hypothetical protein NH341_14045 [Tenacibaculum sp. XPcli2-G]|uniref:hypothetical protein n=1 Tax=Tenacibaculum sp. XPcli2-G TaxID=2954503 RepID=UPI002096ECE8|nr:hypothetical protein [Tenacibaculum sp. XPcli2-G]MCO7186539.1 hypothetical protein [Tenacibaculum sp. XPcli2-G]